MNLDLELKKVPRKLFIISSSLQDYNMQQQKINLEIATSAVMELDKTGS